MDFEKQLDLIFEYHYGSEAPEWTRIRTTSIVDKGPDLRKQIINQWTTEEGHRPGEVGAPEADMPSGSMRNVEIIDEESPSTLSKSVQVTFEADVLLDVFTASHEFWKGEGVDFPYEIVKQGV